jgi:non-ribosomal peptide synthetase component F
MSVTGASIFWLDALHDCRLDQPLALPYDRHRLASEHRTGRGTSMCFDFGQDLSHHLLNYASSVEIKLEDLMLALFYAFLFKVTGGERDLCVGSNIEGRYSADLRSVIGMFVNAIPLRCRLDPHWSCHQLVGDVQALASNCRKYSYFPLQRILAQYPSVAKPAFLDVSFVCATRDDDSQKNGVVIGGSRLDVKSSSIVIGEAEIMSKFDFSLTVQHDVVSDKLACVIDASLDLFDVQTIDLVAQRLHSMLHHFCESLTSRSTVSIYELPITLPGERLITRSMNHTHLLATRGTCVHHEFAWRAMQHPQKLAVELDEQSLTYSELLYYSQRLSLHLLWHYGVKPDDVVCQCVERSLAMVSC